jgi:hypothetical protein
MAGQNEVLRLFKGEGLAYDLSAQPPARVESIADSERRMADQKHGELMRSPEKLRAIGQFSLLDTHEDITGLQTA